MNAIAAFLSFDRFLFPRVVKLVHALGLALIALAAAGGVLAGVAALASGGEPASAGLLAIGALAGGLVAALLWRLAVELWLVIFSINDHLEAIRRGRTA